MSGVMLTAESQDALNSLPPAARRHAEAIGGFTGGRCGFVISTTIIVVCAIINVCINCMRWREDSEREQKTPHQIFLGMCRNDPRGLRRRMRHEMRHKHPEMTRPDVEEAIEDTINYAMKSENADDFNEVVKG